MKKLLKLIVSLAAIYALWLAYNAFDGSTRPNTRATSRSRSTSEFSAYLDASRPLDSTDVAILVAKFNEADRAFARRECCSRTRVTNAETPRRVFAPVSSIPGLTTTEELQNYKKITTASRAEDSLAAIYVRRSILEDELGKRETIASAFVITPDGRWTYYDPKAAGALTPVIRDALAPVATVP